MFDHKKCKKSYGCITWIHHYYLRRDVTYFLKLQLARVCFLYAHFFSSKLVWFFSGPVKSKRYKTNKCVRSNYISKNPFCNCCHNVLKHILKEHCYFMRHCFAVKPNYCNYLSILYHVYLNIYLPAVNRQGHFGLRH